MSAAHQRPSPYLQHPLLTVLILPMAKDSEPSHHTVHPYQPLLQIAKMISEGSGKWPACVLALSSAAGGGQNVHGGAFTREKSGTWLPGFPLR